MNSRQQPEILFEVALKDVQQTTGDFLSDVLGFIQTDEAGLTSCLTDSDICLLTCSSCVKYRYI